MIRKYKKIKINKKIVREPCMRSFCFRIEQKIEGKSQPAKLVLCEVDHTTLHIHQYPLAGNPA